jgi:ADP-dependent phosphofructokinase/glucokinase
VYTSTNNIGYEKVEKGNLVSRERRKDGRRKKGEGRRKNRKCVNYIYQFQVS